MTDTSAFVQEHYRYNFIFNLLDGAFFTLGLAFFSASTVLPLYVRHLADVPLLIGLIPALTQAGWFLPQLFTAQHVSRQPRRLPYVMRATAHERFPVLLLGLSILLWPQMPVPLALAVFFLFTAWQSLGGGFTATGWVDLVARVMPLDRRGRLLGFTNLAGSLMGAAGAALAAYYLRTQAYPQSFGYVFVTGAAAFLLSWFFLGLVREPDIPVDAEVQTQRRSSFWRSLPGVLGGRPNLRRYLLARVPAVLCVAANGFVVVYAVDRFGLPDQVAGGYTAALALAGALANPILGLVGDRAGHKVAMELGLACQVLALGTALLAQRPELFYVVFALQGISNGSTYVSALSIIMEFGEPAERPTIVGLANTIQGIFYLLGPVIAGTIATLLGYRAAFWTALALAAAALVALALGVQDPRRAAQALVPVAEQPAPSSAD